MMPERFDSGIYVPQTSALMKGALDSAWTQVQPDSRDEELVRLLLASAIIDLVDVGVIDQGTLVEGALKALRAANRMTRGVVQKSSGSAGVAPLSTGEMSRRATVGLRP
jgi:hypothetical protein